MQGSILVRWSDPGSIHQELSTLCSEPGSPLGPGACCVGRVGRPVSPAILLPAFPALGLQVCTITLTSFTWMLRMKFRSSYFQDKHFTNSHLPSPITTSLAVFALVSRALLCVIGSLKNFRIFLYVDMFLANFPRFCLHENVFVSLPSVFGDIFFCIDGHY